MNRSQTVVVLGASDKPERYSHKAQRLLQAHGHRVLPVHPKLASIAGLPVLASLAAINEPVDTLTLYVGPERGEALIDAIVALRPTRVIFNPGSESPRMQQALDAAGIDWEEACTLVLLNTGQF